MCGAWCPRAFRVYQESRILVKEWIINARPYSKNIPADRFVLKGKTMPHKRLFLLALALIALGAWFWSIPSAVPADRPHYSLSHLVITRADKTSFPFDAEMALSPSEQAYGLMFVRTLPTDKGMIFPYDPPREVAFWMKDTFIPLDMLFIGPDHKVARIVTNARPLDTTPISSEAPVSAVIEIAGGLVNKDGISAGDTADWTPITTSSPTQ
jgi:uncharacterized membrane protein (UPF0127 family)